MNTTVRAFVIKALSQYNDNINTLPNVTSSDNGKVLQVINGVWTLTTPMQVYSGTGTPDNSQGNNGDLYMQI